jgi:hypothetical protein
LSPGFDTPFGHVDYATVKNFALTSQVQNGANEDFKYTATLFNEFKSGGVVTGTYTGTTALFDVRVDNRPGFFQAGTFVAHLLSATFDGVVKDLANVTQGTLQARIDPGQNTTGTVTYVGPLSVNGVFGMTVDSLFSVPGQYAVNGSSTYSNVPLTGASTPIVVTTVPEPSTLLLMVPGLLGLLATRRRTVAVA